LTAQRYHELTDVETAAWRGFLRAHALLVRDLSAEIEHQHGLPLTSYEVLLHLGAAPGGRMRMADLAGSALLSPSGVTRLVDRLVADGLVSRHRCERDRRGLYAEITPAGRDLFATARITHLAGVRRRFLEAIGADGQDALARAWAAIGVDQAAAPTCGGGAAAAAD
jgi:DNA-binding MarR family transcriptional regulator